MATLNISLPDKMKKYVSRQVDAGFFSSDSEYVRSLIRKDKMLKARAGLEEKIMKGFEGQGRELQIKDWNTIKEKALRKLSSD